MYLILKIQNVFGALAPISTHYAEFAPQFPRSRNVHVELELPKHLASSQVMWLRVAMHGIAAFTNMVAVNFSMKLTHWKITKRNANFD